MKILLLILLSFNCVCARAQFDCPIYGDKAQAKYRWLDSLKNRIAGDSGTILDMSITLERMITPGNDTSRFNIRQFVRLVGYVVDVKDGGAETCNCHSKLKRDLDTHIELGRTRKSNDSEAVVVEVSRFVKAAHADYSTKQLKTLIGKKVIIEGLLFPDTEHWHNSINTNPTGGNIWRRTMWEVHPVLNITVIE